MCMWPCGGALDCLCLKSHIEKKCSQTEKTYMQIYSYKCVKMCLDILRLDTAKYIITPLVQTIALNNKVTFKYLVQKHCTYVV